MSSKVYWGYDADKGRLHISSEPTGNLRAVMEKVFGRRPLYREGDVLGEYEREESDPETVFVHVYYGAKPPGQLYDYLKSRYPHAAIRLGRQERTSSFEEALTRLPEVTSEENPDAESPRSSADWAHQEFGGSKSEDQWNASDSK